MHRYTINHKATLAISRADISPLATPARTFSRLKKMPAYAPAKCIFDGSITTLLSMLWILVEVLSCVHAKREEKPRWFQLWHFCWLFLDWWCGKHSSERVKFWSIRKYNDNQVHNYTIIYKATWVISRADVKFWSITCGGSSQICSLKNLAVLPVLIKKERLMIKRITIQ